MTARTRGDHVPHDAASATAVAAVVPMRPHVETLRCPPAPPKSSRERGRAYRARRKEREAAKQQYLTDLVREIEELTRRKTLQDAALLEQRHAPGGSLCRLVSTYLQLFSRGFRDETGNSSGVMTIVPQGPNAQEQRDFVMRSHDDNISLGIEEQVGHEALLNQWRLYTAAHSSIVANVKSLEVEGSSDDPTVIAKSRVIVRIAESTFEIMFPHVRRNHTLKERLMGREVVYESTTRFRFTVDDRICSEHLEIDLISGLQRAGMSLADVALLMQTPTLSLANTLTELDDMGDQ